MIFLFVRACTYTTWCVAIFDLKQSIIVAVRDQRSRSDKKSNRTYNMVRLFKIHWPFNSYTYFLSRKNLRLNPFGVHSLIIIISIILLFNFVIIFHRFSRFVQLKLFVSVSGSFQGKIFLFLEFSFVQVLFNFFSPTFCLLCFNCSRLQNKKKQKNTS